jgi:hypothetical protein
MGNEERFQSAVETYRGAILEPMAELIDKSPFAAATLALCAVDLLSHVLHNPGTKPGTVERAYIQTASERFHFTEPFDRALWELRCGLVHEFRTGSVADPSLLSPDAGEPRMEGNFRIIPVRTLCNSVKEAFDAFTSEATESQRSSFIERTEVFVKQVPAVAGMDSSVVAASASGTNVPQVYRRPQEIDFQD